MLLRLLTRSLSLNLQMAAEEEGREAMEATEAKDSKQLKEWNKELRTLPSPPLIDPIIHEMRR